MRLIDADEVLKKMDMLAEGKDSMSDFYSGLDTGRELIENAAEDCKTVSDRLEAYESTGLEPKEVQLISNVLREVGETYNCHFNFIVKVLKEYADVGGEKEKRNAREWERMVDAYGTLEGWLCPCGFSSAGAWNYCPSCGSEMYGGEKHED